VNWVGLSDNEFNQALKTYGSKVSEKKSYEEVREEVFNQLSRLKPLPILDRRCVLSPEVKDDYLIRIVETNDEGVIVLSHFSPDDIISQITRLKEGNSVPSGYSDGQDGLEEVEDSGDEELIGEEDEIIVEDDDVESEDGWVEEDLVDGDDDWSDDDEEWVEDDEYIEDGVEDEDEIEEDYEYIDDNVDDGDVDLEDDETEEEPYELEDFDDETEEYIEDDDEYEEEVLDDEDVEEYDDEWEDDDDEEIIEEDEYEDKEDFEVIDEDDDEVIDGVEYGDVLDVEDEYGDDDGYISSEDEIDEDTKPSRGSVPDNHDLDGVDNEGNNISFLDKLADKRILSPSNKATSRGKRKIPNVADTGGSGLDLISKILGGENSEVTKEEMNNNKTVERDEVKNTENLPSNPIEFLRLHPRSLEEEVKRYYSAKEVDKYISRGLIQRSRGRLFI
jgi:hypothetical protein